MADLNMSNVTVKKMFDFKFKKKYNAKKKKNEEFI